MTEIKKATIDDVNLSGFKTQLSPPVGSVQASVFRDSGLICLGPFDGCPVLRRSAYGWRAASQADSCSASWLPHAVAVSEEFDTWLVTELARIDREREEAARPKMPTVKAPEGTHWELTTCPSGGIRLVDDAHGHSYCALRPLDLRSLECEIALIKARAEALGKRIVVAEEVERPMPWNGLWKEL